MGREANVREIFGKQVFDSLAEIVTPTHAALIVVDMQNDFCTSGGHLDKVGWGSYIAEAREIIPRLVAFLDEARKQGLLVVFIQDTKLPDGLSHSPAWLYGLLKSNLFRDAAPSICLEGTWGQEIIAELSPLPHEPVVKKFRSSAFHGTALALLLRDNGIRSVIVTGTATRQCVETTAIDAAFHDYYVVVARDCVSPRDETFTTTRYYDVVTSDSILREWAGARSSV